MDARYFFPPLIVVSILLFSPIAVADPWYEHYAKAEKALEELNWTEAIEQLNQAIERKGDSGSRVRTYGMKIISYFPYFKLGLAYYNLGQWDAAMQAFETEERIGAITRSGDDYADLQRFRNLARQAKEAVEEQENRRIAEIVTGNLSRATELEANGELDEAMAVVGQALAVSPDDRDGLAAMDRLREKVAAEQASRDLVDRVTELTEQGRSLLGAARYEEASSVFRQALSLRPSDELQSLLGNAQARLRSRLDAQNRETLIRTALEEAQGLEAAGDIGSALERLQLIFAVEPTNREATEIQIRLLRTQEESERQRSRQNSVQTLLAQAQNHFDAGRYEQSLSTANRILALDPGNADALGYIGRTYQQINRRLLGTGAGGNIPPAIRFSDFRQDREDGSRAQLVDSPQFRLSGVVIDNSPVDISFSDTQQNELTGTSTNQTLGEFYLTEFQLTRELEPGSSTFRLTATDSENLSSSSEYVVVYERPFFRSPWFYLISTALILSGGVAFFVGRVRKRARLLKRRFNPYVAGPPVLDDNLFFGRERLIERILQTIHNNSLLLYGERRIGKTSIQHHLKKRLQNLRDPDYDFYPVYVDLQGVPESQFFHTLAEDIFQELAPALEDLEAGTLKGEDADYSYRDLVRDMKRVLKHLEENSSKAVRLVLLMDEVDVLNEYDPKVNQRLRSLFMKSFAESLVAVVSGVEIKKHWEGEGSPWYNFFEEIEVQSFQKSDAEELIERPIQGVFKLENGVVDRVIDLTDGQPYLIQRLCVALVNRLHEQNRRTVTLADVDAVGRPEEA